jgi:hypothetical protein
MPFPHFVQYHIVRNRSVGATSGTTSSVALSRSGTTGSTSDS